MSSSVGTKIFAVSILGIPIIYVFNNLIGHLKIKDPFLIAIMALAIVTLIVTVMIILTIKSLRNNSKKYHFYVFSWLCFCSVCSMIMGLELEGLISGFVTNILKYSDVHLRSAFGTILCHWNGAVIHGISITIISAITWNNEFYETMYFWIGSWCNLSFVFIIGILVGKTGPNWMMLFYAPFLIIPFHSLGTLFVPSSNLITLPQESRRSIWRRPQDLLFLLYFIYASLFALFRGLIVLESPLLVCQWYAKNVEPYLLSSTPAPFPKVQMLLYLFSYNFYYLMCIYTLLRDDFNGHQLSRSSIIFAGASLSAQLTYMGASIHSRTPYIFRVPSDSISQIIFWTSNFILTSGPLLFARRCAPESDFNAKLEALRKNLENQKDD